MLLELPHGKSHFPDPSLTDGQLKTGRALCGAIPPSGVCWTIFPGTTMHDIPDAQLCGRCRRKAERFTRRVRGD